MKKPKPLTLKKLLDWHMDKYIEAEMAQAHRSTARGYTAAVEREMFHGRAIDLLRKAVILPGDNKIDVAFAREALSEEMARLSAAERAFSDNTVKVLFERDTTDEDRDAAGSMSVLFAGISRAAAEAP